MDLRIRSSRGSIELVDVGVVNLITVNNGHFKEYRINGNGVVIRLKK